MNLLSILFLLTTVFSFGFSPGAFEGLNKVEASAAPPPFRAMANSDGLPDNLPACIEPQHTAWQLVLISNSISLPTHKEELKATCEWPLYVYAYLGNDFNHTLGISEALQFEPSVVHPDINYAMAYVDLDFRPYLDELCTGTMVEVHYSLALVYMDEEGQPQLMGQCDAFFPKDLFIPNSFVTSHKRLLACEGNCSSPPDNPLPEADMFDSNETTPEEIRGTHGNLLENQIREESEQLKRLSVSPNPFSTFLDIRLRDQKHNYRLELRDLNGRLWMEKNIVSKSGQSEINLSTIQLPPGLYLLTMESDSSVKTYKLLKASLD